MRPFQEKRLAGGRCVTCGRIVELSRTGRTRCQRCNDRIVDGNRQRRNERQAQGLCVMCGKVPPTDGYITCAACREKHTVDCKQDRWQRAHPC